MDPKELVNVKITSFRGKHATTGVHIVPHNHKLVQAGLHTRKLMPGEVVAAPYGKVQRFIEQGAVTTTSESATRPLLFQNGLEAKWSAPGVHVNGEHQAMLRDYYRDIVAKRLAGVDIEEEREQEKEDEVAEMIQANEAALKRAHKENRRAPDPNEIPFELPANPEEARRQAAEAEARLADSLANPENDTVEEATAAELAGVEETKRRSRGRGRG